MTSDNGKDRRKDNEKTRHFGRYKVKLIHTDKKLYDNPAFTKNDLFHYHHRIAGLMLPHLKNRMLTMERYPDGIHKKGFFHRQLPDYFPDWFGRVTVKTEEGRQAVPVCNNLASLLYLVNQGSITQHVWLSKKDLADRPDQLIFDLDPPGKEFEPVRRAALDCLHLLDELDLVGYVKTTGSKGLHVTVPLRREHAFDEARKFARDCARLLVKRKPDSYTLEQRIDSRGGRLYLDVQRNAYGQTVVAPYSPRPVAGAPIATPIARTRLQDHSLHARSYTIKNIFRHLSGDNNPWKGMHRHAKNLKEANKQLQRLLREADQMTACAKRHSQW